MEGQLQAEQKTNTVLPRSTARPWDPPFSCQGAYYLSNECSCWRPVDEIEESPWLRQYQTVVRAQRRRKQDIHGIQRNNPVNSRKENTDQLIETAAEQLADLLWKCWLASNNPKTEKRTKSNSPTDILGSSWVFVKPHNFRQFLLHWNHIPLILHGYNKLWTGELPLFELKFNTPSKIE